MVAECIAPIQGTRARLRELDDCGAPTGPNVVIDGFVQVAVAPQYEAGDEVVRVDAAGNPILNGRRPDQFDCDELTIEFCVIDTSAVVLATGQPSIVSGGVQIGFWVTEDDIDTRFSLEVWQADSATCTSGTPRFAYWAWPHVRSAAFTDLTIEDAPLEWALLAFTDTASPDWVAYDPAAVTSTVGHRLFAISRLTPPALTPCGEPDTGAPHFTVDPGPLALSGQEVALTLRNLGTVDRATLTLTGVDVAFAAGGGPTGFTVDPAAVTLIALAPTVAGTGAAARTVDTAALTLSALDVEVSGSLIDGGSPAAPPADFIDGGPPSPPNTDVIDGGAA